MASKGVVHHPVLRTHIAAIGYGECRKVMRFVHLRAVRGASGGQYSRGTLAGSIYAAGPYIIPTAADGSIVQGFIGSPLDYAASVEYGAEIHPIFPKGMPHVYRFGSKAPRQLKFFWRGRVVYTPHVPMSPGTIGRSHPGQRGKYFLRKAMLAGAARYGWRYFPGLGGLG